MYRRFTEYVLSPAEGYQGHSHAYATAALVDHTSGSVHTGLSLNELGAGGRIDRHVHSYEEGVYLLDGEAAVSIGDATFKLGAGDFAVFKVGTSHAWRALGSRPVRWLQMAAPQPKPAGQMRDTFFAKDPGGADEPRVATAEDRAKYMVGHFDASQPKIEEARPPGLAPGVFLKWLIDEKLGARHFRLLFIEYEPGAAIAPHDHTFEESYFILSGEVQATVDGVVHLCRAGDVVWTGVGCVHAFANVGTVPVRWLETFSPQPPAENVFRFSAEWDKRAAEIEGRS